VRQQLGIFKGAARMKVAYLVNLYPSISHSFIRREILALEAMGVEVERFALRGWDATLVDPADKAELARTRHTLRDGVFRLLLGSFGFALRHPRRYLAGLRLALRMAKNNVRGWPYHVIYLAHAVRILRWLDGTGVSHCHAHFGTNSAEIAALLREIGGPSFSFTTHGAEVFDEPRGHALPVKAEDATALVASCAYIGSQIMYHISPRFWPKVEVVHCGLPAESFDASPAPLPDAPVFLSVGRFSPEKGQLILLDAFKRVHAARPEARLVMAGDGPMRPEVEAKIADLGLGDAVQITGWVTAAQVRDAVRAARCLVHPSFTEGLPVVIMEAMAAFRPVISTYIAGIPELVREGSTGWLVPAGQVDDLADAMLACAEMPDDDLMQMARTGAARVAERHDVPTEAAKLKALFEGAQP
jgi:glycosyltransferase involved in cell wall biosynthesis